jgi:phosphomannomutase
MPEKIVFGTDGWRGRIADDYTFANLKRCAQGFADYLNAKGWCGEWVVIGHDMRFHSENFAASAAEVLAANGFRVYLIDNAIPAPVISFSVLQMRAVGAINITASHNPPTDNGFKVRDPHGAAIDPAGLQEIEARIPPTIKRVKRIPITEAEAKGLVVRFDPTPAYIEHLHSLIDLQPIKEAGLNVLVDTMWGNGAGWFPRLLAGGRTKVMEIHNQRNPYFPEMIRPEPIPPNVDVGLRETVARNADVLVITDGDADRLGIGDEKGEFIDQLRVFGLLAYYLLEVCGKRGPIVKTISTSSMLTKLGKLYRVPVYETGVGFKYMAPKMMETDAIICGDDSGGYIFQGHVLERDGILAGLYILDMMVRTGLKPTQLINALFAKVGAHFYDRLDRPFSGDRQTREKMIVDARPATIGEFKLVNLDTTDGYKFNLEDGGWMLIRFSGIEPIMRVCCETTHADRIQAILDDGLRMAGLK